MYRTKVYNSCSVVCRIIAYNKQANNLITIYSWRSRPSCHGMVALGIILLTSEEPLENAQ
jgi:hypothetical protein